MLDDTFYFSIYKTKSNYKVEKKEKSSYKVRVCIRSDW